jgi:hypothetical protein
VKDIQLVEYVSQARNEMRIVIDRFEGEYAVCEIEKGRFVNLPRQILEGAKEGDIVKIEILKDETAQRKKDLQARLNGLFSKN